MIPFDPTALPQLTTRKALLVLDFQNEFLSEEGALPVTRPDGFVARTIKVADAFRRSGSGEVIWVKSEFDKHRPVKEEQIIVADNPILPSHNSSSSSKSRKRQPAATDQVAEADPEAFLSRLENIENSGDKPTCVLPGSVGAETPPIILVKMNPKDFVLTKSDYSAFETPRLLKRLRARFITELYICGALTNISVYATALDAGRHGLALTLIEDCCGYRGVMRHTNAVRRLIQLTGCDTLIADDVMASLAPPSSRQRSRQEQPRKGTSSLKPVATVGAASASKATTRSSREPAVNLPVRTKTQDQAHIAVADGKTTSTAPSQAQDEDVNKTTSIPGASQATEPSPAKPTSENIASVSGNANSESEANPGSPDTSKGKEKEKSREFTSPPGWIDADDLEADPDPPAELPVLSFKRADSARRGQATISKPLERVMRAPHRRSPPSTTQDKEGTASPISPPPLPDKEPRQASAPSSAKEADLFEERIAASSKMPQLEVEEPRLSTASTPDDPDEDSEVSIMAADATKQSSVSEEMCEGDTRIFYNVLPPPIEEGVFERLKDEVKWLRMAHQGGEVPRLVCIQGQVDKDGNMPVYRHPSDESPPLVPFTETVIQIKDEVEKILGHPLNHVLIQLYRDGNDYISEHSDKTLDIVKGSFICNVSLGAERTMTFRTKRPDKDPSTDVKAPSSASPDQQQPAPGPKRSIARARLPHNSLCRMGLETNMRWLHAIRQDKRRNKDKEPAELAFDGGRISLTFRHIGTHLNRKSTLIWGQGAISKTRNEARPVINGQTPEAIKMLQAFGTENHSSNFDWDKYYGEGFDVLHMSNAPRFFSSSDAVVNMRIQLMLAEAGIGYAKGSMGPVVDPTSAKVSSEGDTASRTIGTRTLPIKFVDNDPGKSVVEGDLAILLYLEGVRSRTREKAVAPSDLARRYTRFQQGLALLDQWRSVLTLAKPKVESAEGADNDDDIEDEAKRGAKQRFNYCKLLKRELSVWNGYAAETANYGFIAGGEAVSVADFALWPVLHEIQESCGGDEAFATDLMAIGCKDLLAYYLIMATKSCVKRVLKGALM